MNNKKLMRREAEWVAARARRAGGEMGKEVVEWAKKQPGWERRHKENSEGAGAAEERRKETLPTRWKGRRGLTAYPGTKSAEPDEKGK